MADKKGQVGQLRPITPEPINIDGPGHALGHWDYPTRCANLELALATTRERIEEWDRVVDPHGWWDERPHLIAMYNAIVAQPDESAASCPRCGSEAPWLDRSNDERVVMQAAIAVCGKFATPNELDVLRDAVANLTSASRPAS